ncbi:MAG: DUF1269 domain-containing protein [Candidatus Promineifilaceae bacterium]
MILGKFYGSTDKAVEQLKRYEASKDELGIYEAAAFVKTLDGEEKVVIMDEDRKKAHRIGALAGAVLGILGGPATIVVLGIGGAAAGDLVSRLTHAGISKEMIDHVEEGLEPGSSAVFVMVDHGRHHLIVSDLKEVGCVVKHESVSTKEAEQRFLMSPGSGTSQAL